MSEVIRFHPDTRLVICGTGAMLHELQDAARGAGVERHVVFAGLIDNLAIVYNTDLVPAAEAPSSESGTENSMV